MAMIKDKQIKVCVCGKLKAKTETYTAKQQVLAFLGIVGTLGILVGLALGADFGAISDPTNLIVLGFWLYAVLRFWYETFRMYQKKHTFICSLRLAFYRTI